MSLHAEEPVTEDEGGFFSIAFRKQTYRNILYLALAGPLGLIYFATIVLGAFIGFALLFHGVHFGLQWTMLLWAPVVIVYVTISLVLTLIMIAVERHLATWLLKLPMPGTFDLPASFRAKVVWLVDRAFDRSTVRGLVFLLIKFPLGIFSLASLLISVGLTAVMIISPWFHGGSMQVGFGPIYIGGAFKILLVILAFVIATMALHFMSVLASFSRACAQRMLDRQQHDYQDPDALPMARKLADKRTPGILN